MLARVGGAHRLPRVAEITVAAAVLVLALLLDLRAAIGFSSFGVLLYYAVANASAWTLHGERIWPRVVPSLGVIGCLVLVAPLPWRSVAGGVVVVVLGTGWYAVNRAARMAG